MAQMLPNSRFVGIDLAPGAVRRGEELAAAAGLANVEIRCADLQEVDAGSFDYIVAHGVYSWIAPEARQALLSLCRRSLNPHGIAFVSYNAYPGSYMREMAREVLRFHLSDVDEPGAQLQAAHELMRTIVEMEATSPYAKVMREQMKRMLAFSDPHLFHDDLAEFNTAFYFHEFVAQAAAEGLRFLGEADLFESRMREVPASAVRLMESLGEDEVVREQYLDFFKNRTFRQTLLCHAEAPVERVLDAGVVPRFAISAVIALEDDGETYVGPAGVSVTTSEPHVRVVLEALAGAWPVALDFAALAALATSAAGAEVPAEIVHARLRTVLLEAYLSQVVQLHGAPPPVSAEPGERPLASPLARAQCERGDAVVSSLLYANTRLDGELESQLLPLLDGTRDRDDLAAATGCARAELDGVLKLFALRGLLQPVDGS